LILTALTSIEIVPLLGGARGGLKVIIKDTLEIIHIVC
jgi:hypothetical protein